MTQMTQISPSQVSRMDVTDATALIAPAVRSPGETWADLGAGHGLFTRAVARLLGPDGHVYAIDRDVSSIGALHRLARDADTATITPLRADFADPAATVRLALPPLDGLLLANALHYVPYDAQAAVLARLATWLAPAGQILVVEYENRAPNRWVPYPVSFDALAAIVPATMAAPVRIGDRRSAFGGTMYAAATIRVTAR